MFGLIFSYWIRCRWGGWWRSYNYITAAGLDSGLILSTIVIFFAITFPGVSAPNWWGNTASFETMVNISRHLVSEFNMLISFQKQSLHTAIRTAVTEGEIFGPSTWQ